jgi:hypothetical protein
MDDKDRGQSIAAVENLARQSISLSAYRPVDRHPMPAQGYPQ